jgi:hypothetical protein
MFVERATLDEDDSSESSDMREQSSSIRQSSSKDKWHRHRTAKELRRCRSITLTTVVFFAKSRRRTNERTKFEEGRWGFFFSCSLSLSCSTKHSLQSVTWRVSLFFELSSSCSVGRIQLLLHNIHIFLPSSSSSCCVYRCLPLVLTVLYSFFPRVIVRTSFALYLCLSIFLSNFRTILSCRSCSSITDKIRNCCNSWGKSQHNLDYFKSIFPSWTSSFLCHLSSLTKLNSWRHSDITWLHSILSTELHLLMPSPHHFINSFCVTWNTDSFINCSNAFHLRFPIR